MSIIVDYQIRVLCDLHSLITPFHERTVRNGKTFGLSSAGYDIRIAQSITIRPGSFRLASSLEQFSMPNDLLAVVHDKSSWARMGLTVQNTVIEPGWRGFLTLELVNHSREHLLIASGDPIAQIIFHRLDNTPASPYKGKYQDQPNYPVLARRESQ